MSVRLAIKLPNFIDDVGVVGVDDVGSAVFMTREVKLYNMVGRNELHVFLRVPAMISSASVDIVNVE